MRNSVDEKFGITKFSILEAHLHIEIVVAKSSKKNLFVVAAKKAIEVYVDAMNASETRVDDLNNVEPLQPIQIFENRRNAPDFISEAVAIQSKINIARIIFESITVRSNRDRMPQRSQSLSQIPVQTAIFSDEKDFHVFDD